MAASSRRLPSCSNPVAPPEGDGGNDGVDSSASGGDDSAKTAGTDTAAEATRTSEVDERAEKRQRVTPASSVSSSTSAPPRQKRGSGLHFWRRRQRGRPAGRRYLPRRGFRGGRWASAPKLEEAAMLGSQSLERGKEIVVQTPKEIFTSIVGVRSRYIRAQGYGLRSTPKSLLIALQLASLGAQMRKMDERMTDMQKQFDFEKNRFQEEMRRLKEEMSMMIDEAVRKKFQEILPQFGLSLPSGSF